LALFIDFKSFIQMIYILFGLSIIITNDINIIRVHYYRIFEIMGL